MRLDCNEVIYYESIAMCYFPEAVGKLVNLGNVTCNRCYQPKVAPVAHVYLDFPFIFSCDSLFSHEK